MQRLAFFDLDDTLADRTLGFRTCIRSFCSDLGFAEDVEQWLLKVMYERAYRSDFERLRERFAVSAPVEELWQRYCGGMADAVTCTPAVLSGLERLRSAGWSVVVVTNGAGDIQRAKLARTGIDVRVDAVCISEEVGIRKPEVGIFREAARLMGADGLWGGWMVGDSAQNDVVGGRAAGLRTIWVSDGSDGVEADHVVSDAAGAIDLLLGLEGARA
ncbi:HAD family hydrolase [Kitasatospora aureofaciens]|uniref:HAD family hydrolase n=1 Tax=Kitasatospora aureofaciens TaxID=1894 RepID=UPI001C463A40|nr:HAD family hydrolase [Kitasatospora aureofaciens]MBV6697405.1 HAD family hydrolase [Kitasatospora aureofaciens]